MRRGAAALLGVAAALCPAVADAQKVELASRGRFDREVRARIEQVLERGEYAVWTRDTTLAEGDTVAGDVFLLRATARIAGAITGQLIAVESEIFVRPRAELRGGAVVLNGGYYGTQLAKVGEVLHLPIADYRARAEADGAAYRIIPPGPQSGFALLGVSGLLVPSYERVSALVIPWGFEVRPGASAWPHVQAVARYRTAREHLEGDLRLAWAAGDLDVTVEGGRTTASEDGWIGSRFENSLAAFGFAADHWNHYESKFARAALALRHGTGVRHRHGVRVEWEQASSLGNEDPFSLFELEDGFRPNPPIDDGRLVDVRVASELTAVVGRSALRVAAFWELADETVAGEFTYACGGVEGSWRAPLLAGHILRVRGRAGGPLAGRVPAQRWTALGGYKTLPTFDPLSFRGDTHVFIQSTYFVPLLSTGLGDLRAWVQHAVGSAWSGRQPPLEQNLGLGLELGPFGFWLYADPAADGLDVTPGFGLGQF